MTTIAFDGKVLAADTAMAYEGVKLRFTGKIRRFASGCLAGFAGDVVSGVRILDWLESDDPNAVLDCPEGEDSDALLITPDGEIAMYDCTGTPIPLEGLPIALGSGGNLAMGAMLVGATAVEAVQLAIERDPHSGFEVIWLEL